MATTVTQTATSRRPEWVDEALELPGGATYLRCALQVNPYGYLERTGRATAFSSEADYNAAIVEACLDEGIDVVAVTDHYRVDTSKGLLDAGTAAGLRVFPGFEAVSKDGVHFLCLFEPGTSLQAIERKIGDCGVHELTAGSPPGDYDALELLARARGWKTACIAAHVASDGGLLRKLSGQSRIKAWKSPDLFGVALPGPVDDAPGDLLPILRNQNPDYRRDRLPAVTNAKDVCSPEDLKSSGASCWIKMSEVSIEGLRQAFLDPDSRIRLASDPEPVERTEIVALRWDGGFLDGEALHLNDNLNVLIGGRGAGKSTVVESIRYALGLEPVGEDARKEHDGIVRHVLRSGTRVSLLVRSHAPSKAEYVIERNVPNPPTVRDADSGQVLDLAPGDVVSGLEVYGQHEISEVARSPEKRTRLLERFVEHDTKLAGRKESLRRDLEDSRRRLLESDVDLARLKEELEALPGLEHTLERFKQAGVEEQLKDRSLLVREERVIETAIERLSPFDGLLADLRGELPVDRAFAARKSLEDLPGHGTLAPLDQALAEVDRRLSELADQFEEVLAAGRSDIEAVRRSWDERRQAVEDAYQEVLRELQRTQVDGAEFISLRERIEALRPRQERRASRRKSRDELRARREALVVEWEDLKGEEFRQLEQAAKEVSGQLRGRVRVRVEHAADRSPLYVLLQDEVGGRLKESCERLRQLPQLSLKELAEASRAGSDELEKRFSLPSSQAQRIADAGPEVFMKIEELELPSLTKIELNVAPAGESEQWQALDELSTGQKATAILLLLLLESDAPLVVDQPEDDLDNRFITEGVVPRMKDEKRRRQFVFSTHNANIPVLGDAELIVGLSARGEAEAEQGRAQISPEHMGSIDLRPVRDLVEELLEGGPEAFELRRMKYGF